MSFFYLFFIGIIIGSASVIPGVSGGVIAVIFNVYDKMIYSLNNIFKSKKNFIFILILSLGVVIGIMWFSRVLSFLYTYHNTSARYIFIGLILGGVPYLFKEIKNKGDKPFNIVIFIFSFLLSLILFILSKGTKAYELNNIFINFISGFIYAIGKVVPGISGSFLLIITGMYEYVLSILSNPFSININDIYRLGPFLFGLIVGVIIFLKLMNYLLTKKFSYIYSAIIGFTISGAISLLPSEYNTFGIFLVAISFYLSFKLSYNK